MANEAVIGALSVIIGGDASALDKMLKGAQSGISSFAKNVAAIAGGIGLEKAITGAVDSVVSAIKQGIADTDALAKMSEKTGMSIDQLSRYKYAADLAGVGSDDLTRSFGKLSDSMVSAATGAIGPATQAFSAMSINVKNADGSLKSQSQVIGEIANKFAGYRDGAAKAALAQAIFGDGGSAMIPLLNKGADGLRAAGDEAAKFGLVLDSQTQFAVQSLNENLKKMDAIKQGLALTITAKLLPSFEQISVAMLDFKENGTLMNTVSDAIATVLKGVISIGLQGVVIFQRLAAEIGAFVGAFKEGSWLAIGDTISKAFAAMEVEGQKTAEVFKELDAAQRAIFADPSQSWDQQAFSIKAMNAEVQKLGLTWTQTKTPILGATEATKNALDMFLDREAKQAAATTASAQTVGQAADAQARLRIELEAEAIAKSKNIKITDDYRDAIREAADASAAAAQRLAGANLTQASLAPWQTRNQLLTQYNGLLRAGAISLTTYNAASMKVQFPAFSAAAMAALDFGVQIDQVVTNSLNGLASTLAQVITGAKSAGEAFKAFGIQVITQLIEMVIKALIFKAIMIAIGFADGGPVGMEQSGSATGLTSTGTGGLYDAGGYTGPGGKYQPAGIVHKGEVVFSQDDVAAWGGVGNVESLRRRALPMFDGGGPVASAPGASSSPAAPANVTLNWRGGITDRSALADLINGLNGMFRNGYRLKLAGA